MGRDADLRPQRPARRRGSVRGDVVTFRDGRPDPRRRRGGRRRGPARPASAGGGARARSLRLRHGAVRDGFRVACEAALELGDAETLTELLALVEAIPPGLLAPSTRATR